MYNFEKKIKEWYGESAEFEGAKHYFHMPQLGEDRYLHRLYKPLTEDGLKENLEESLVDAHPDLIKFWKEYNGIDLFMKYISVFGFCSEEFYEYEPNNIDYVTDDHLIKMENDGINASNIQFCGGYSSNQTLIYLRDKKDKFYLINMNEYKPLQVFDTLEEFIDYYIEIEQNFRDENGLRKLNVGYDAVLRPKDIEFQKQFPRIETLIGDEMKAGKESSDKCERQKGF